LHLLIFEYNRQTTLIAHVLKKNCGNNKTIYTITHAHARGRHGA